MNHIFKIHSEFKKQADSFNDSQHTIGSHEIMDWIIANIRPVPTQEVIDVAAGFENCGS